MGYFKLLTSESGKREGWTIVVLAKELIANCNERITYHSGRVVFWEQEQRTATETLRDEGIKLRTFGVTNGERIEAEIDQKMGKRLSECQQQVKYHKTCINKFRAFRALCTIASRDDSQFVLNADDCLFFNIGEADNGEETPPQIGYDG